MDLDPPITSSPPPTSGHHPTLAGSLSTIAAGPWQAYADRCSTLKGLVACCVFDTHTVAPLAHNGPADGAVRLAQQGSTLLAQMHIAARALGLDAAHPDATITTGAHHLLLRHVGGHAGVGVILVLRADQTTPSQARADLDRIAPPV
jgi:hypothetical protein